MNRRPLVALLLAYGISLVGSRLSMIALPLFVLATTGSATRTGIVAMVEMAPYVVAQALAGPVTDRLGPRRVSLVSDAASAVVVGLIPVLHAAGALHFGTLLGLVAFAGLVRGPGDGAKYVMAPAAAQAAGAPVERVLGLEDGISRAASVIGPLGAAALVTLVGAPLALAIDAASFAVALVVIAAGVPGSLGRADAPDSTETSDSTNASDSTDASDSTMDGESYLERLREGARFVRRDGLLKAIIGMVATTNLLDAALSGVLLAVWARQQHGGGGLMGLVVAVMSAGAVIGAVVATTVGHRLPRRATFTVSFFLIGGPRFAVLGLGAPLWLVLTVVFVGGIGTGTINPILGAVELERIPEHLRARVLSLITSCAWTLIPFGGLLGGLLSDRFGVSAALLVCGAVYTAATTVPALRPEWAQMNRRAEPPAHQERLTAAA
jgi:MFS family permease